MAKTTIHTCDICKQSKSEGDLASLTVRADGISIKGANYSGLKIDICKDCLEKKGFIVEYKKEESEKVENKNKITLEDRIYDFLADMGVVFGE